jgi:hydroxysqualene synthase
MSMVTASSVSSGKTHRDENFPVASRLIRAEHREPILAFYRFVRTADDVADHATLAPDQKLALLDGLQAALEGRGDVRKLRYADWSELMHYCSLSAMPVGRYVLDVHGEPKTTWAASDPLCAALQVINHLQDCGEDFRNLDRVYLPLDVLAEHGTIIEALAAPRASPALRAAIVALTERAEALLADSAPLPAMVRDRRLAFEIAVIQRAAHAIVRRLKAFDPLSERVHLRKADFALCALSALARLLVTPHQPQVAPRQPTRERPQ